MSASLDFSPILNRYNSAVGAAVAAGELPRGFGIDVFCAAGMFNTLSVVVTRCDFSVVEPGAARGRAIPRLNASGERMRTVLLRLANTLPGIVGETRFDPDLLRRQTRETPCEVSTWRPAPPKEITSASVTARAAPAVDAATAFDRLSDVILERLAAGGAVSAVELSRAADAAFGGSVGNGARMPKDAFEGAELAMNRLILLKSAEWAPTGDTECAVRVAAEIGGGIALLPTQTRRDDETQALQQFSTPPDYAFVLAWVADLSSESIVLEPSAGNGGLAVHALNAGATVHVNEISTRRTMVLRRLGFDPTEENGEQIHNILAGRITPNVVLMNPPFSRSPRTGDRKNLGVAAAHIEAALALLAPGGRLVAITGNSSLRPSRLKRVGFAVRANVLVNGRVYAKHGTTIETRVVVIDKVPDDGGSTITGAAENLEHLIRLLAPLRKSGIDPVDVDPVVMTDAPKGLDDDRFATYRPATLGAALGLPTPAPHPGRLVESRAMAAVRFPAIRYVPSFPASIIAEGRISDAQLEAVCLAGRAHETHLPAKGTDTSPRRGFFIGDGTGVGKGREISAIILDNQHKGLRRHIWITKDSTKLLAAAKRDFAAVGGDPALVFPLRSTPAGDVVKAEQGVMLVSFGELRSNRPGRSRLEQIIAWAGPDFEGCLVMDEAHKMGNAVDEARERGIVKASQTALAGIEIQARLPEARVVYVSATAASEVKNFAYADRLGIYGPGTPFHSKAAFIAAIEAGGVAAMEIVARDLKAMGLLCSRSLSHADVKFERLVHCLTPDQAETYDALAEAWRVVLSNIDAAMRAAGSIKDPSARSTALSSFWGANQRFWNQVLTSMQLPTAIRAMDRDIAAGHAVVIQLVNTLEAQQERALAREGAMEALDDLDLTPRDILMQYLESAFPVLAYESYIDDDGNERFRPVVDAKGNRVLSASAVATRDEMLARVGSLRVPHGPLEAIIDHFGVEKVAEITGRSRRVVTVADPDTGLPVRRVQTRSEGARLAEMRAFADDEKSVLIFSNAANTGVDFHASRAIKNQRLRRHYVLQAGWNAKECTQALGRTHRSDQAQAPEYVLVTTNLRGQLRFVSSIAQRLGQLGALTKGQRDTGSQGLLSERDNLEGSHGSAAVVQIIHELHDGATVADMTLDEFERDLGLRVTDKNGDLVEKGMPPVRQFLNRLLALPVARQNRLFDEFQDRLDDNVQAAIDNGTFNRGVESYAADRIELVEPPRVVHVDAASGAETTYVHLRAWCRREPRSFEAVSSANAGGNRRTLTGFVRDRATGGVFAMVTARARMSDDGKIVPRVRIVGPFEMKFVDADPASFSAAYSPVSANEAEVLWNDEALNSDPLASHELHLCCGALLPVWDRLDAGGRVYRVVDENGAQFLGRMLLPGRVRSTLAKLGADEERPWTPEEVIETALADVPVQFANGWSLRRARVNSEYRIEVLGWKTFETSRPIGMGCVREIVQYRTRLFLPTGNPAAAAALLAASPVMAVAAVASAA